MQFSRPVAADVTKFSNPNTFASRVRAIEPDQMIVISGVKNPSLVRTRLYQVQKAHEDIRERRYRVLKGLQPNQARLVRVS